MPPRAEAVLCGGHVWPSGVHLLRSAHARLYRAVRCTASLFRADVLIGRLPTRMHAFTYVLHRLQLRHGLRALTWLSDRTASKDTAKNVKYTTTYCPLRAALGHRWTGLTRRQTRELNPAATFVILGECHAAPSGACY